MCVINKQKKLWNLTDQKMDTWTHISIIGIYYANVCKNYIRIICYNSIIFWKYVCLMCSLAHAPSANMESCLWSILQVNWKFAESPATFTAALYMVWCDGLWSPSGSKQFGANCLAQVHLFGGHEGRCCSSALCHVCDTSSQNECIFRDIKLLDWAHCM